MTYRPRKLRLLDLCCCQGGSSAGYTYAGFDVTGVDNVPQPKYPYRFVLADALAYLAEHFQEYDVLAGSPPCQLHTKAWRIRGREHPDLIGPMRDLMRESGKPYIIENVPGAPLIDPIELCGAMFGLNTYRHRLFESNLDLKPPTHPAHMTRTVKMGRALKVGEFYHAVGNFSNVDYVRTDMGARWMNRDGLRESIPPAYTAYIGSQVRALVRA